VSLSAHTANGESLARTVIRRLVARDEAARFDVVIEPGACIESFRIQRRAEGYLMEFVAGERQLQCPLALFQARTSPSSGAAKMKA